MASRANNPENNSPTPRVPTPDKQAHFTEEPVDTSGQVTTTPDWQFGDGETSTDPQGENLYESINQDRDPIANGEMTRRFFPGEIHDAISLSEESLIEMGMEGAIPSSLADTAKPGDKVYVCLRAPAHYGKIEPGYLRQKKQNRPSLKIPLDPVTREPYYATKDLIYATVSREEYLKGLARHNMQSEIFTRGLIEGAVDGAGPESSDTVQNWSNEPKAIQQKFAEARQALAGMRRNSGYPAKMPIEEIEKWEGIEKTIKEERKWARNGRSERPGEYEEYEARQAEKAKKQKRSFSAPGSPTR